MTDEEKQVELDTKAVEKPKEEAQADSQDASEESAEGSDASIDKKDTTVDYKAEFLKEQAARKRAEQIRAEKRFKSKEKPKASDVDESAIDDTDEDRPLTARELTVILARERQENQKLLQQQRITDLAKKLASSDDEAELIVEIHKNRTFPDHLSLEDQMEEAYVLANRKRLMGENSELKRALRGKGSAVTSAPPVHHDAPKAREPQVAPQDRAVLVAAGFIWNGTARRFEKKLKNGDILVREKTGGTSVIQH